MGWVSGAEPEREMIQIPLLYGFNKGSTRSICACGQLWEAQSHSQNELHGALVPSENGGERCSASPWNNF